MIFAPGFLDNIPHNYFKRSLWMICTLAMVVSGLLLAKSVLDFSHSGPAIRNEVLHAYLGYSAYALTRLALWAMLIAAFCASAGALIYYALLVWRPWRYRAALHWLAGGSALLLACALQFCNHLLYLPAGLMASLNYRASRTYPVWELLSPSRLANAEIVFSVVFALPLLLAITTLLRNKRPALAVGLGGMALLMITLVLAIAWDPEPGPAHVASRSGPPNIVMIGSDTLRGDRLGINGYARPLTPHIDALARQGANFTQCIVPLGRTAPSMTALLTGTWPQHNGITTNYIADAQTTLRVAALPQLLRQAGYRTGLIGDWAGSDLGKINFGFDERDVPDDQWNLKFLLRQGPMDIRLFLSLFTHNSFGKRFLPEIYYLAGTPLTPERGRDARRMITRLAATDRPFFMNVFIASTHAPFGAHYPYYQRYTNPNYHGESRFSMAELGSIEDILHSQEQGAGTFDIQQINDLYDGAVASFDDEVGKIMDYLRASGLDQNTVVVIYSDHGIDLFENDTWGQGNVVSDYSYRVPLVIRDPRRPPRDSVTQTVRSVDIAPTLLELAGLQTDPHMDGASLLPFLTVGATPPDRTAFAVTGEWVSRVRGLPADRIPYPNITELIEIRDKATGTLSIKPEYANVVERARSRLVREGRWALVYFPLQHGELYQLYDLTTDRAMRHDVIAHHPEIATALTAKLHAWETSSAAPRAGNAPAVR